MQPFRNKHDLGLEVEFANTLRENDDLIKQIKTYLPGFNMQHDGSVETFFPYYKGLVLDLDAESFKFNRAFK